MPFVCLKRNLKPFSLAKAVAYNINTIIKDMVGDRLPAF